MTLCYEDLPRPIRTGIALVDPRLGIPLRVIVMQFNPDTLSRAGPSVPGMPERLPIVAVEPTYVKDFRRIRRKSFT